MTSYKTHLARKNEILTMDYRYCTMAVSLIIDVPLGGYPLCTPVMYLVLVTMITNKLGVQIMCKRLKRVVNQ